MRYSILFQFHEFVLLRAQPDRFAVFQRVDAVARLHAFDQVHLARVGRCVNQVLGCEGFADKTAEEVRADFDFAIRNGINFLDLYAEQRCPCMTNFSRLPASAAPMLLRSSGFEA